MKILCTYVTQFHSYHCEGSWWDRWNQSKDIHRWTPGGWWIWTGRVSTWDWWAEKHLPPNWSWDHKDGVELMCWLLLAKNISKLWYFSGTLERSGASSEMKADLAENEGLERWILKICTPGCLDTRAKAAAPMRAMCGGMEGRSRVAGIGRVTKMVGFCKGSWAFLADDLEDRVRLSRKCGWNIILPNTQSIDGL